MTDAEDGNDNDRYQESGLEGVRPDNRPNARFVRVQPDQRQDRPDGQPIGDVQRVKKGVLQDLNG